MSAISPEEVARLASLARIDLNDEERATLAGQLDAIVDAVAKVSEVAGPDVPATSHPMPLVNVWRADELKESTPVADLLAGAPASEADQFKVPQIIGEEM